MSSYHKFNSNGCIFLEISDNNYRREMKKIQETQCVQQKKRAWGNTTIVTQT